MAGVQCERRVVIYVWLEKGNRGQITEGPVCHARWLDGHPEASGRKPLERSWVLLELTADYDFLFFSFFF